jgi:hypothetical protein
MDMGSILSESYPDHVNVVGIKKGDLDRKLDPPHEPEKQTENERNNNNCLAQNIQSFPTFPQ